MHQLSHLSVCNTHQIDLLIIVIILNNCAKSKQRNSIATPHTPLPTPLTSHPLCPPPGGRVHARQLKFN